MPPSPSSTLAPELPETASLNAEPLAFSKFKMRIDDPVLHRHLAGEVDHDRRIGEVVADRVYAAEAVEHVGGRGAGDRVVEAGAVGVLEVEQRVGAGAVDADLGGEVEHHAGGHRIVAHGVDAGAAVEHVGCAVTGDRVVAAAGGDVLDAAERIGADLVAERDMTRQVDHDRLRRVHIGSEVHAVPTEELIVATVADERVIPSAAG